MHSPWCERFWMAPLTQASSKITKVVALIPLLMATPCLADFRASLEKLDMQTRLEQACDMEVMSRIRKTGQFAPDRAKSYVISEPKRMGHTLIAKGAAFRSGGKWYELSFICKGSSDHLTVQAIDYKIGKLIPTSKWPEYGLWK